MDLSLLCDVDEIPTRHAIHLMRRQPPAHYYHLHGLLYQYSYRWSVREMDGPIVIRYGSLSSPLDDYVFMPAQSILPGILHHHCRSCFPQMQMVLRTHTGFPENQDVNPNQVYALIACGYDISGQVRLNHVDLKSSDIFLPNDARFDFLKQRMGFTDLVQFNLTAGEVKRYIPHDCDLPVGREVGVYM
jgi:hypothetical protein